MKYRDDESPFTLAAQSGYVTREARKDEAVSGKQQGASRPLSWRDKDQRDRPDNKPNPTRRAR